MKRVRLKPPSTRGVRLTPPKTRAVDPDKVAAALGAEAIGKLPSGGTPHALRAIREQLFNAMRSSGGRPALEGVARRQKVPMRDEDWQTLEELASRLGPDGPAVSAGQLASQLLRNAIRDLVTSRNGANSLLRVSEPSRQPYRPSNDGPDLPAEQLRCSFEQLGEKAKEALMTTADTLRAEGRAEGRADILLRQITLKYGRVLDAVQARITTATLPELETWAERVLTASTLDEVFG